MWNRVYTLYSWKSFCNKQDRTKHFYNSTKQEVDWLLFFTSTLGVVAYKQPREGEGKEERERKQDIRTGIQSFIKRNNNDLHSKQWGHEGQNCKRPSHIGIPLKMTIFKRYKLCAVKNVCHMEGLYTNSEILKMISYLNKN